MPNYLAGLDRRSRHQPRITLRQILRTWSSEMLDQQRHAILRRVRFGLSQG